MRMLIRHFTLFWVFFAFWLPGAARNAQAAFSEGIQAYAGEDYDRALALFEEAVELNPTVSEYHHWLGKAAGRKAERVHILRAPLLARKARQAFEKAVELDKNNIGALTDLLDYYLAAPSILGGGEEKARAVAARLAKINPAEGYRAEALLLTKRKDYEGAEKAYRKALELEPNKIGRLLELAAFLAQQGRYAEADALFDRAGEIDPNSPDLLFTRAQALVRAGRNPEQARELLHRYRRSKRQPDDPPPSEVEALLKKISNRTGG
jgi:tetratricopeptide (TPR) repeat protein